MNTEQKAIKYFKKWVLSLDKHAKMTDTSREGVGYDFLITWNNGKKEKFEIKGTRKLHKIPDMSINEFDKTKRLKADFLFVVGNLEEHNRPVFYKIPKNRIAPENLSLKQTYEIKRFQNRKNMSSYLIQTRQ